MGWDSGERADVCWLVMGWGSLACWAAGCSLEYRDNLRRGQCYLLQIIQNCSREAVVLYSNYDNNYMSSEPNLKC